MPGEASTQEFHGSAVVPSGGNMMDIDVFGWTLIIRSGAWIPILLMIPNMLWMLFPPVDSGTPADAPLPLVIPERAGLVAVLVLPFCYSVDLQKPFAVPVLIGMGLSLAGYYFSWGRYFAGGRSAAVLGAPFLGIPIPMAVFPVLLLLLSSYWMGSGWMFAASLIFGAAHIWISKISLPGQ
jgi:hypothetical protein